MSKLITQMASEILKMYKEQQEIINNLNFTVRQKEEKELENQKTINALRNQVVGWERDYDKLINEYNETVQLAEERQRTIDKTGEELKQVHKQLTNDLAWIEDNQDCVEENSGLRKEMEQLVKTNTELHRENSDLRKQLKVWENKMR